MTQSFQSSQVQPLYPLPPVNSVRNRPQVRRQADIDPRQRREYEDAIARCDQAIARKGDDVSAWYQRGQAQANLGAYNEAIASFNQALRSQPNHAAALVFRAVAFIHLNCYEEALLSCNTALTIQPHHAEAWLFRGVALRYLNRYKEAYASYDHALGIRRPANWLNRISRIFGWFRQ
ncbi:MULTISPECIES: tetratricopeptide repeat protein [Trichocoleus]|uniref:Tetratricopeptide repeat protein n=1 Tax=Trichocoleus desertorum GB2-A4 TaxID=2933944 RepID=A0ABV0J3I9_9CYAN|nr:tetratricopeptide repeat protein [Trichocoleus sp. FACHB-46]MBD1861561.1 tetratricopeptide repeat protein [Trichocoleus sp. FACHB-46]